MPQLNYKVEDLLATPYVQSGVQFSYSTNPYSFGNVGSYNFGLGVQFIYSDPPYISSDPAQIQAIMQGLANPWSRPPSAQNWVSDPTTAGGNYANYWNYQQNQAEQQNQEANGPNRVKDPSSTPGPIGVNR